MSVLIPSWLERSNKGQFLAYAVFFDISGFTSMSEALMKRGKHGAEELSIIINKIFKKPISILYESGGEIATFAGDAFTAIFRNSENQSVECILDSVLKIRKAFHENSIVRSAYGQFTLAIKTGIGYGNLQWYTKEEENVSTSFISGVSILEATTAETFAKENDIVISQGVIRNLGKENVLGTDLQQNYFLAQRFLYEPCITEAKKLSLKTKEIDIENDVAVKKGFFPKITKTSLAGEIRQVASVFVGVENQLSDTEKIDLFHSIHKSANSYGGYFNGTEYGDKGSLALILFGAPLSFENTLQRALQFALKIREQYQKKIKVGIHIGNAYTGYVGSPLRGTYTALGNTVNMAARIMGKAPFGEVLIDEQVLEHAKGKIKYSFLEETVLKGLNTSTKLYVLDDLNLQKKQNTLLFFGRNKEREFLENQQKLLQDGKNAGTLLLLGEAGMGKSRIVSEVIPEQDRISLVADGILRKSFNPFIPFLRQYFKQDSQQSIENNFEAFHQNMDELISSLKNLTNTKANMLAKELRRTESFMAALINLFSDESLYQSLDPQSRFENTLEALTNFFLALSLKKSYVLWIDNIQWLDFDTVKFLNSLLPMIGDFPIFLVLSGREVPKELHTEKLSKKIELRPLTKEEVFGLFIHNFQKEPEDALLNFLMEKSLGNPFVLEQILEYLKNQDALRESSGKFSLSNLDMEIPAGVHSLITAKIDRLGEQEKQIIHHASVLGMEFERDLLEILFAQKDLESLLHNLQEKGFFQMSENGMIRFQSPLVREVAYDMQLSSAKKKLHLKIAQILEDIYGDDPTRYADFVYHYRQTNVLTKLIEYLWKAAYYTQENFKNEKSLLFYSHLLDHVEAEIDKQTVHKQRAKLLDLIGQWDKALQESETAIQIAQENHLYASLASLYDLRGEILLKKGDLSEAEKCFHSALEIAQKFSFQKALISIYLNYAKTLWRGGQYKEAKQQNQNAFKLAKELKQKSSQALALYQLGVTERDLNHIEKAKELFEKSLTMYRDLKDKRFQTYPLYGLAVLYLNEGKLTEAEKAFSEVLNVYQEIGYKSGISAAELNLGVIAHRRGNFEKALEIYTAALNTAEEIGENLAIAYTLFSMGAVYYDRAKLTRAKQFFRSALSLMQKISAKGYYSYVLSYMSCVYAKEKKWKKAVETALLHFKIAEETSSENEMARTYLALALVLKENSKIPQKETIEKATGLSVNGLHPAEKFFQKAMELAEKSKATFLLLHCYFEYAAYLQEKGRLEQASLLYKKAHILAQQSEMEEYLNNVQILLKPDKVMRG